MKKSLFLATVGFAGLLLGTPQNNAQAEVNLNINIGGPRYAGDYGPDFIYLDDYGFAVSWGWDYDVIRLGNFYFIYRDGGWFRSPNYRGPWARVRYWDIPYQLRRYSWNDIRRRRDREYRRYDRAYWDRHFRDQRARYGDGPFYAGDYGPDFIYLDDYGFAVSWGWDYDVIWFGNYYFIYRDGGWFRSSNYRGPWAPVRYLDIPYQIRRHDWNDIRRRRDVEYKRHDRAYWDRHFREQRMHIQRDDRDRRPDFRPDGRPDFRNDDGKSGGGNIQRLEGRPDLKPLPLPQTQPQPQGVPDGKPDGKWFNDRGSDGKGFERKNSELKGFEGKGSDGRGFEEKGSDGRRFDRSSFERKDSDGKSFDRKGFDGKSFEGKGADRKNSDGKGSDDKDSKDNSNGKSDNSGRFHGNPEGGWNQVR
ncbi:MAG: hypothetical protein ACP5R6_03660 [Chlorobaculum sp.]